MARAVHVMRAAKDYPEHDIKKGEPYWWWKFRFGGKHYSKNPPRRSQLTQSSFLGSLYDIEDDIADLKADDGLEQSVSDIAQALRDLGDECESSKSNMPDSLQESETGQLLQDRYDACGSAADELEAIDFDVESRDEGTTEEEYWQEKLEEVQAVTLPEG